MRRQPPAGGTPHNGLKKAVESTLYQYGMGWWGDAWDGVKSVAKKVQGLRLAGQVTLPATPREPPSKRRASCTIALRGGSFIGFFVNVCNGPF